MSYGGYPGYGTAPAPPPPPPATHFEYAPAPSSAFLDYDAAPRSPLVVEASPMPSRSSSRVRPTHHHAHSQSEIYVSGERPSHYLAPSGYGGIHRSNSERGRVYVEGDRGRRSKGYYESSKRSSSRHYYDDDDDDDRRSGYSHSSYGSRDRSRSRRRSTRSRHSRSPSWASGDDDSEEEERYASAMAKYKPAKPTPQEEALNAKLRAVQEQLEKVQVAAEASALRAHQAELEAQKNKEIEKKVKEQMEIAKKKEEERVRKEKEAMEAEKARIAAAAKKLLEEQAAAAAAEKQKEEEEKAKIQAIVDAERAKYAAAQQGKKTYTRFSKVHLAKEALDERQIPYTEETDHFLVHRFVEKTEQQYLWARTKEIRNYYRQIEEAAAKAPMVRGPDGGYVKYVQIAGQPYPIALPVTVVQAPGGGQQQKVDTVKLKWTDIFKAR